MKLSYFKLLPAFSLVEVTVALGICAFCLLAVYGLLPAGFQCSQTASEETAATNLLSLVAVDLRETPRTNLLSSFFNIPIPSGAATQAVRYFSEAGRSSTQAEADSRYRVTISFLPGSGYAKLAMMANVLVSWPAQADPSEAAGRIRTFIAVDRN